MVSDLIFSDIYTSCWPVKRAPIMNAMTLTIESVHGVKQTLVLGPPVQPSASETAKEQNGDLERGVSSGASSKSR